MDILVLDIKIQILQGGLHILRYKDIDYIVLESLDIIKILNYTLWSSYY